MAPEGHAAGEGAAASELEEPGAVGVRAGSGYEEEVLGASQDSTGAGGGGILPVKPARIRPPMATTPSR